MATRPFWNSLGLGLHGSEGKQHPFRVSRGQREWPRGSSCVALACAHRGTHFKFSVTGLLPTTGAKERQVPHMVDKNTQSHRHTHTLSRTVCLSQTHGCIWSKQISLPETSIYNESFLHTDPACLRQRLTLTAFICADFLRHMHPRGRVQPTVRFPYTPSRTLLPTTRHSLKCSQVQTQTPVCLYRRRDMLLHSHTQLASAAHAQMPTSTVTFHRSMRT